MLKRDQHYRSLFAVKTTTRCTKKREFRDPHTPYTEYAGLEIPGNSDIAWPFSRQIAIGNAGPTSALESMGGKPFLRHHFVNIAPIYKQ